MTAVPAPAVLSRTVPQATAVRAAYRIGVIPGDGIGPEVSEQALRVLQAVAGAHGITCQLEVYPYSGAHYLATGQTVPPDFLDHCRAMDAILLGAIGHPQVEPGLLERAIVWGLREGLDLYVNLRPVRLYAEHLCPLKGVRPEDLDLVVVRENTEDVYAGIGGALRPGSEDEVAVAVMAYTRSGVERVIRYAFEQALRRRGRLTLVDKANAIRPQDLWRRVFARLAEDYPQVETEAAYVDAASMWLIQDPRRFDVVVTTNLFGDILTDLGAALQGGLGVAASANLHPGRVSMFEPVHGSAPRHAGRGTAVPIAAILAAAMMLAHLGEGEAAAAVEGAVARALASRRIPSTRADGGLTTAQMGDVILEELARGR